MMRLSIFQHPLPQNNPPRGYGWSDRLRHTLTINTSFRAGIDQRDIFRGRPRCIIFGINIRVVLGHCHVVGRQEIELARGWLPQEAKDSPDDPRNGLLMCPTHHRMFDAHQFFIRYVSAVQRFVCVNYSGGNHLDQFHGRAVALEIRGPLAPFPSLFIMRTVGYHPFQSISLSIPRQIRWQNWILMDGVFNVDSGTLPLL